MVKYIKGYRHILKSKWSLYVQYTNAGRNFLSLDWFLCCCRALLLCLGVPLFTFVNSGEHVFEMSVTRQVIEVTSLVHVMVLTILWQWCFISSFLVICHSIVWSFRMMCACVLYVSFIPMYNCVRTRIISLMSVMDL
jgi:hypothetical protein